jgi:hypothetical protein
MKALKNTKPLPSFHAVRNYLELEVLDMETVTPWFSGEIKLRKSKLMLEELMPLHNLFCTGDALYC